MSEGKARTGPPQGDEFTLMLTFDVLALLPEGPDRSARLLTFIRELELRGWRGRRGRQDVELRGSIAQKRRLKAAAAGKGGK